MYNYIFNLKKTKNKQLKQITNNYNYIFFCKYNNFKYNDIIKLKKKKINFYNIKLNLSTNKINIKGQGPVSLIFFNNFKKISLLQKENKLNILFLLNKKIKTSVLKLNKILNKPFLLFQLNQPLLVLYTNLLYINNRRI